MKKQVNNTYADIYIILFIVQLLDIDKMILINSIHGIFVIGAGKKIVNLK